MHYAPHNYNCRSLFNLNACWWHCSRIRAKGIANNVLRIKFKKLYLCPRVFYVNKKWRWDESRSKQTAEQAVEQFSISPLQTCSICPIQGIWGNQPEEVESQARDSIKVKMKKVGTLIRKQLLIQGFRGIKPVIFQSSTKLETRETRARNPIEVIVRKGDIQIFHERKEEGNGYGQDWFKTAHQEERKYSWNILLIRRRSFSKAFGGERTTAEIPWIFITKRAGVIIFKASTHHGSCNVLHLQCFHLNCSQVCVQ